MELDQIFNFKMLARALDLCSDGILITDAQQTDNPIVYCNERFREMTGYARDEIIGRNCRFLQNDDTNQPELEVVRDAIAEGASCKIILRNYRKDGEMFFNQLSLSPITNDRDDVTHFIGIQNDVTKEKQLEEEMEVMVRKIIDILK